MLNTAMAETIQIGLLTSMCSCGGRREERGGRDKDRRGVGDRDRRGGRGRGDSDRVSDRDVTDLKKLARRLAESVANGGDAEVIRKPLNSFERRVVHMEIAEMDVAFQQKLCRARWRSQDSHLC